MAFESDLALKIYCTPRYPGSWNCSIDFVMVFSDGHYYTLIDTALLYCTAIPDSMVSMNRVANAVQDPSFAVGLPYPMPVTNEVRITIEQSEPGPITSDLYDMNGRRIAHQLFQTDAQRSTVTLHVSDLPAGVYRWALHNNTGLVSRMISVLK